MSQISEVRLKAAYVGGMLTTGFIVLLLGLFMGYQYGFGKLYEKAKNVVGLYESPYTQYVELPEDVLEELTKAKAVISYSNNPTGVEENNTILVKPNPKRSYELRPGAHIKGYVLKSEKRFNFVPPVLYLSADTELSGSTADFIRSRSRTEMEYHVGEDGFRVTLPAVSGKKKIMLIGDSVLFGVGVDDNSTIASYLQKLVGDQYTIVNAGVGGYDGMQAFEYARELLEEDAYAGLIYIACENDFFETDSSETQRVFNKLSTLTGQLEFPPVVVLESYMEYTMRDLFQEDWRDEMTDPLHRSIPEFCKKNGFVFMDWDNSVRKFMEENHSLFSRFALYVDHVHLSPLGNRLLAKELYAAVKSK